MPSIGRPGNCPWLLDPPYYGIKAYRYNFSQADFLNLAELLAGIKGKFLMSLNDTPKVRQIFKPFQIQKVATKYSCMRKPEGRARPRGELLIRNY